MKPTRPTLLVAALVFGLAFPLIAGPKTPRVFPRPYFYTPPVYCPPIYRLPNVIEGDIYRTRNFYQPEELPRPYVPFRPITQTPRVSVADILEQYLYKRP